MPIAKGDSARARELGLKGGGRPKGSTDKKWYNVQYHLEQLLELAGDNKEERKKLHHEILFALFSKLQVIPATPEESKDSADQTLEKLRAIGNPEVTENDRADTLRKENGVGDGQSGLSSKTISESSPAIVAQVKASKS